MNNRKGLTLIELIVALGLTVIVLLMIFPPIILSHNTFGIQNEKVNTISNARYAMDYLTRQIRKSEEIEVIEDAIIIDSIVYKLENRTIFKDDTALIHGIDDLKIRKIGRTLNIEIVIKDSGSEDYKLRTNINMR